MKLGTRRDVLRIAKVVHPDIVWSGVSAFLVTEKVLITDMPPKQVATITYLAAFYIYYAILARQQNGGNAARNTATGQDSTKTTFQHWDHFVCITVNKFVLP